MVAINAQTRGGSARGGAVAVTVLRQARTGEVTLATSGTITVKPHYGMSKTAVIKLVATDAVSAAALAAGNIWWTASKGEFTIHHPASASPARKFLYSFEQDSGIR